MKTAKKILSLLLTLALVLNLGLTAMAAEGDPTFSLSADKAEVAPGETVTVTLSLDKAISAVTMLSIKLKVQLDGADVGSNVVLSEKSSPYGITNNLSKAGVSNVSITYLDMVNMEDFDMAAGTVAELTFTPSVAGTLTFALTACELTETYYDSTGAYTGEGMKRVNYPASPLSVTVAQEQSGDDEGVRIPDGAPFSAITTDAGAVTGIAEMGTVTFTGYSSYTDVPHYHVTIPASASQVLVTHPSAQDPFADASYNSAYGYWAETSGWTGSGLSFSFADAEDGYTVTLPLSASATDWSTGETTEMSFLADESGSAAYAVAVERNDYSPICFFTFSLAADESVHSCVFDQEKAEEAYLATAATCTAPATYHYSCVCGEKGTETFIHGEALGHSYSDGTCQRCGEADPDYVPPVTGLTLDRTSLSLTVSASATLVASVTPEGSAVTWSSSDDAVATVSGGTVTAVGEGEAVITARAGDLSAQCAITVTAPVTGYTARMPEDITVSAGDSIPLSVILGHSDGESHYNAFDLVFSYDSACLRLTTESLEDMTLTVTGDTIRVQGYGEDRASGTAPFTLNFEAVQATSSRVTLTSARVDNSGHAIDADAPEATLLDGETAITVTGYTVTLPDGFTGGTLAKPGEDYTFAPPEDLYDYPDVTVQVGGTPVDVAPNEDGSYTVPGSAVTGNITVTSGKVGKTFCVTLPAEMSGEPTAQYMSESGYTATLSQPETGYTYSVSVTVGGEAYTGFDVSGSDYIIPGGDITGDIVFTVTKTPTGGETTYHTVTFTGSGAGAAGSSASVAHGASYTLTLTREPGYRYTVTAADAAGEAVTVTDNGDGTYTVASVTSNLVFTVEAVLDVTVEVHEYVTLDGKVMFLVLAKGDLAEGKVYAYGGSAMYYSEVYGAWAYLTIEENSFNEADAAALVSAVTGSKITVSSAQCDVNGTGLVDINDAQLVYDIYNGHYDSFDGLAMTKFLWADVNGSMNVTVEDATAIVAEIQ